MYKTCRRHSCTKYNDCIWTNTSKCGSCSGGLQQFCKGCAKFHDSQIEHASQCSNRMTKKYNEDGNETIRIFTLSKEGVITAWICRSDMYITSLEELYLFDMYPIKNVDDKKTISRYHPRLISDYYENGDFFVYERAPLQNIFYNIKNKINSCICLSRIPSE